jgi:hypothetical protein
MPAYLPEEISTPAVIEEFLSGYPKKGNEDYDIQMMDGLVSAPASTLEPPRVQMPPFPTMRTDHRR